MSISSSFDDLDQILSLAASDLGFAKWGFCSLLTPVSLSFYRSWLEQEYHGEMTYLLKHLPTKENPKLLHSRLESAFVFSHPYVPHPKPRDPVPGNLRTAFYAQGEDYHLWLKEKLEVIAEKLRLLFPDEVFLCLTDSSPILERDLAYRAGLGWFGKNTCLIDPERGSFLLLGEIVTSLQMDSKVEPVHDFCGNCNRCLEICPTKALEKPRLLNAQKCISYLTIESRQIPAENLRSEIGDWFFGCDLCQAVCPWNEKAFKRHWKIPAERLETQTPRRMKEDGRNDLVLELRSILTLSGKQLQRRFESSPLGRAGAFGLRRNALVVAANLKLNELTPEILHWKSHEKLGPLVDWALEELEGKHGEQLGEEF